MNGSTIKNIVLVGLSAIGSFISKYLGGLDEMMTVLLVCMVVDYITGIAVAIIFHKSTKTENGGASSKEGFKGIVRKLCILMLIGIAHCLDQVMGVSYMRMLAIFFFIGNEGISILENMGLMGVPYPEFIKKALEVIKEKGESGENNE